MQLLLSFFIRNLFSFFQFSLLVDFFVRAPLPHGGNIITTLREHHYQAMVTWQSLLFNLYLAERQQ